MLEIKCTGGKASLKLGKVVGSSEVQGARILMHGRVGVCREQTHSPTNHSDTNQAIGNESSQSGESPRSVEKKFSNRGGFD